MGRRLHRGVSEERIDHGTMVRRIFRRLYPEQNLRTSPGTEPLRETFPSIERVAWTFRRSFSEARVYFSIEMGEPRARCSRTCYRRAPARLTPSYGGPLTIGTETVAAQPGDRTVVYQIDPYSVDAFTDCRAIRSTAHG